MSSVVPAPEVVSIQICPRCSGPIEIRGEAKLAAMSRATPEREIEICSPCGSDEAMREHATGTVVPVAEWPVPDPHRYHQPLQDAVNTFLAMNGIEL